MVAPTPLSFGQNLRTARTESFRVLETRHARGLALARHAHERACVNFVLDGCYREDVGSRSEAFTPLWTTFKPAGTEHANDFARAPAQCLLIELLDEHAACEELALGDLRWTRSPEAARAALALWHELATADACSALVVDELAWELYAHVLAAGAARRASPSVRAAREALHDSPGTAWTLSSLARHVDLHPSHLARAFRAAHGRTAGAYLRALRQNELARGLALGTRPIAELAGRLGFADQSHATRLFRGAFGTPPAAWRRTFHAR